MYSNIFLTVAGMFSIMAVINAIENGGWFYLLLLIIPATFIPVLTYKRRYRNRS